eukprot:symbB.v1.2.024275.t1/scaffold2284.1/size83445/3
MGRTAAWVVFKLRWNGTQRRAQEVDDMDGAQEATPRIRLWCTLTSGEYHTLSMLAEATSLSLQEVRHHLDHVIKQARSLKNKSAEWRARRQIPEEWDTSSVRVEIFPSTCEVCQWEANSAAKKITAVKVCKNLPLYDAMSANEGSGEKSHLFNFTGVSANKAGMGADRKLVADFVYQKSKNSQYTQHQLDLDAKQQARAEVVAKELKDFEQRMTPQESESEERKSAQEIAEVEKHRDLTRTYCVVDMDMFYAAVEIRDQPELANKPVAIGGLGMICTANYVARLYGVRSAMPGFIAVEMVKNPQLVGSKMPPDELIFITPNFAKYTQVAMKTWDIFREYDPHFHAYSLDEAYLDLTDFLTSKGENGPSAEEAVQEMREKVKSSTGLTCSAGIGPNRMVAKIASDEKKPDGQTFIPPTRKAVLEYMDQLPVRKLPGCGKVLEQQISTMLQVKTCSLP